MPVVVAMLPVPLMRVVMLMPCHGDIMPRLS
jgi:hypothetical protein